MCVYHSFPLPLPHCSLEVLHFTIYNLSFSLALSIYLSRVLQVEEKPDVTYNDVGGCKEQIEKLKEVVETPLLHVRTL